MITDNLKKMLDKIIDLYGYRDALSKFKRAIRGSLYYREQDEELIQNCLNYIEDKWIEDRNKKISSILEKRILNFKDFNYKFF